MVLPIWRRAVAPVAEWVARAFWSTIRKPDAPIATRLTQNNKREAKGAPPQAPTTRVPSQQNICAGCGKTIQRSSTHCPDCSLKNSTASLISGAKLGRVISQGPQAQERRKETKRLNDLARSRWSPSSLPSWLSEEAYREKIRPLLARATLSQIASAIRVSIPYASDIRRGRRRPHPRHWEALAKIVGASLTLKSANAGYVDDPGDKKGKNVIKPRTLRKLTTAIHDLQKQEHD